MLKIEKLVKAYGDKLVLHGIDLEIKPGEIYGFIGKNGAGKTTTIKCVMGLLDYDQGNIFINGMDTKKDPLACKQISAYIPDNPRLYEFLTGAEYINFVADIYGVSEEDRMDRTLRLAKVFDLKEDLGSKISSYSHGMKQKLAIIAALVHDPKLLILDEPFVGLDPTATHFLKELFQEMVANGAAIFFSTHVLEVAQNLCHKIAIIKDGKIVKEGATKDVIQDSSLENIFMELMGYDH
ncbi:MAG: ABC transporter ATP-binding protein [Peptoniphilus sp. oral taxon 375]|uniref:ABC transporter ATP-binding protein n=1 Tax=Urinicoccus timonensis TaxID=2024205 RepID=UPI000C07497A|nr:ABC transporter ATP-binding protein [Urinicoccus timonensis]MBS4872635.1 ABC transporter ATP-binding protein [Peptoniphilus sp. oral taxon 375]